MPIFTKRFHLIAIATSAGYVANTAATAAGHGDMKSAFVGGAICIITLAAAGFFATRFIK